MPHRPAADIEVLITLVRRLRAPDGCPWDREQRLGDLRPYLLEEAHEVAEALDTAVEQGELAPLGEELGDLLFQIVFLSELAREQGAFDLASVIDGIHGKMVARHPHVFGDEQLADADAVRASWEQRKLADQPAERSLLAGVPAGMPALAAAYRITQKASGVGFDWPQVDGALAKVHEEMREVEDALQASTAAPAQAPSARDEHRRHLTDEVGDLLLAVANLARKLDIDPEAALAAANRKFRRRFAGVEQTLAAHGTDLAEATLEEMDAAWEAQKQGERPGSSAAAAPEVRGGA